MKRHPVFGQAMTVSETQNVGPGALEVMTFLHRVATPNVNELAGAEDLLVLHSVATGHFTIHFHEGRSMDYFKSQAEPFGHLCHLRLVDPDVHSRVPTDTNDVYILEQLALGLVQQ